jgi:L-lactate dehydrogenase complex protein LldF
VAKKVLKHYLKSVQSSLDNSQQGGLNDAMSNYYAECRANAAIRFVDYKNLKQRGILRKHNAVNDLVKKLIHFETAFTGKGGKIVWAETKEDAVEAILDILEKKNAKHIVKTNSNTLDEINISEELQKNNLKIFNLEFNAESKDKILLDGGLRETARLWQKQMDFYTETVEETLDCLKAYMLAKCTEGEVAITGANFLVSDIGAIVSLEEKGNIAIAKNIPRTQIVVVGIDKMLSSISELDNFLYLLSVNTVNKLLPFRVNITTGANKNEQQEIYLVLLDNKRSKVIGYKNQRGIAHCIHCDACKYVCPVYKLVGDAGYDQHNTGPLAAVLNPLANNSERAFIDAFNCTMCKKCSEVCPMDIPLHKLILNNRKLGVDTNMQPLFDSLTKKIIRKISLNRKSTDSRFEAWLLRNKFKKIVENSKVYPEPVEKSFNKLWKESQVGI